MQHVSTNIDVQREALLRAEHEAPTATTVRLPGPIQYTRTPTVVIPDQILERHRIASMTHDANADAFRVLRTQLLIQIRKHGWRTIAVTSPNRGAGKSTVSLNLAISFAAEMDYTALLVDTDLRDPDLRHMLELEPGPGLAEYLMGKATLPNLLLHPNLGNLVLLPGGSPVHFTSELMRSPMMAKLILELRGRYSDRLVVFDVPPILAGADMLALSSYIDATTLLVEECKTSREDIMRSCDLLRHSNLIGVVLNKSRELSKPEPHTRPRPGTLQRFFGAG